MEFWLQSWVLSPAGSLRDDHGTGASDGQGEAEAAGRGQAGEEQAQDLSPCVQTSDGGCGEDGPGSAPAAS